MTIIDTTVWVDFFNNVSNAHTEWLARNAYTDGIAVTDLILCELLQGKRERDRFQKMKARMAHVPLVAVHGFDIAVASAENYRSLRSRGVTVRKFVDVWTASTCIELGLHILHHDRDYDPFEEHLGLKVVHP